MNVASLTAPRWAVSTRTRGEVLVAGASTPALEIVLLGVPAPITPAEAEGWLRDLAGIALETGRAETRSLALPPVLYHALSGLLFSQAEFWGPLGDAPPCSLAFLETADGAAFGWSGDATVQVAIDGRPVEPRWVVVRDEEGREARGVQLAEGATVQVMFEYAAGGTDAGEPPASVEAEWTREGREPAGVAPPAAEAPVPGTASITPESPAEAAAISPPVPQPGAAPIEEADPAMPAHEPYAADADAEAPAAGEDEASGFDAEDAHFSPEQSLALESLTVPRESHPVARWLGRLLGFARRAPRAVRRPATAHADEATPLSTYDSLLSEDVPATPPFEQTALALDANEPHAAESSAPAPPPPPGPERSDPGARADAALAAALAAAAAAAVSERPDPAPAPEPHPPTIFAMPRVPVAPELHSVSPPAPAMESARERLERATQAAAAGDLPVLHVPIGPASPAVPLAIEREPVGADETFRIPSITSRSPMPAAPPAAVPPPPAPAPPEPAPQALAPPQAPPVLHVRPAAGAPAPPVLRVQVPGQSTTAPPVLRVEPGAAVTPPVLHVEPAVVPPRVIVPTPPVHAAPDEAEAFAPSGAAPAAARRRWPAFEEPSRPRIEISRRTWVLLAIVVAVFAAGWLVGVIANPDPDQPDPVTRFVRAIGLGGSHYTILVNSAPPGAWIAVDGKDAAKRTPAQIEVPPGAHTLTLSLPDLGSAQVPVRGRSGDRIPVAPSLNGALDIQSSDAGVPISVALDGRPLGYAPLQVEALAPGLHEVQFSGPGMPAWAQTIQVGVRQTTQLVAHPMSAPATGVIQVQATMNDEQGSAPLSGAQVWVDGELRAVTPTSLDLPRGPHSLRLTWHGQTAPVQVIDLPGGNERFASFSFGLDAPSPQVTLLGGVHPATAQQTAMVTAALSDLQLGDVREAWLHVRMPDGLWRRYPMTAMRGARGPVVVCVFPPSGFDAQGQSRWYVSASTLQGDEYFSELQTASLGGAGVDRARPAPGDVPEGRAPAPRRQPASSAGH